MSLLVFRAGSHQPKAVPLSLVTRLEEIDCRKIEISDGRHLVQYRGHLMPLLRLDTQSGLKQDGAQPILVFSDGGRSMGLVVDEIIDIVEERLNIEVASERPGVLGYAVIKGNATEIVDIGHFLPQAFADWFRRRDVDRSSAMRAPCCWSTTSAFFRDMLTPLIKAAGCQVVAVGSAAEALEALEFGAALRPRHYRHRNAGHGRVRARRRAARHAGDRRICRSSPSPRWCRPTRSSAGAPSASTISSPNSTAPA